MSDSNYVLAGFETLGSYLINFAIKNKQKLWNDNFSEEHMSNFLSSTCHGFLHSFGQNFTGKKKYDKYVEKEAEVFTINRDTKFFDNCTFIADSGGFQASIGRIDEHETDLLVQLYHEFLEQKHEVIDRAFILDLPPGPGCKLFNTFDDIFYANERTYNLARQLPDAARNKVIYIHHFRTPKLWDIYTDILNIEGMFDSFSHFGTGGIVANMASDTAIPCIIYVLPLIPVLKKAIEQGRTELSFHILGGANFRDIFFYEVFSKIVKEKHDVELTISYDSSGVFKALMRGRMLHVMDDSGFIRKVDLRTVQLDKRFTDNIKTIDIFKNKIDSISDRFNFKRINSAQIYCPNSGTFPDDIRLYAALLVLRTYADVQLMLRQKANEIYPLYKDGLYEEFNRESSKVTQSINAGKITRKQKAKTYSLINSIKMLESLDTDHCKYIVNKFLAKDEFIELEQTNKRILTI